MPGLLRELYGHCKLHTLQQYSMQYPLPLQSQRLNLPELVVTSKLDNIGVVARRVKIDQIPILDHLPLSHSPLPFSLPFSHLVFPSPSSLFAFLFPSRFPTYPHPLSPVNLLHSFPLPHYCSFCCGVIGCLSVNYVAK